MGLNVEREVAEMRKLPMSQLKEKYEQTFNEVCRSGNRTWLIKRIAWGLQAREYGGLSERARQYALQIADVADLRTTPPKNAPTAILKLPKQGTKKTALVELKSSLPRAGTVLQRKYKGRIVEVEITDNGVKYDGEIFASLSAVAKHITGSHWSGHRFFGIQGAGQ